MNPVLPEENVIKKILAGINMNEKELEESVVHLRNWLMKQPHLPKSADDVTLKSFIIGSKSLERAKEKIDSYYTTRVRYSTPFFDDRDPLKIKWVKGQKLMVLPDLTPDGSKVVLFTMPPRENVPDVDTADYFKFVLMFYEVVIRRFYMCSGVYALADMSNLSLELTLKGSLTLSSQFAKAYQESYPIRLKKFIAFNAPSIAESFFNTFMKPFFSEKLRNRMYLHSSDHKCLEEYGIPIAVLPSDYEGGQNAPSDQLHEADRKYLEGMREWFLKEGSEKSMEDFRPKSDNDTMKGTYRRIQTE